MTTLKIIAYDYEGEVQGTLCVKCHKWFTNKNSTWLDGSEAFPLHKEELQARDSKKKLYIECGECGNAIWGKVDLND